MTSFKLNRITFQ